MSFCFVQVQLLAHVSVAFLVPFPFPRARNFRSKKFRGSIDPKFGHKFRSQFSTKRGTTCVGGNSSSEPTLSTQNAYIWIQKRSEVASFDFLTDANDPTNKSASPKENTYPVNTKIDPIQTSQYIRNMKTLFYAGQRFLVGEVTHHIFLEK